LTDRHARIARFAPRDIAAPPYGRAHACKRYEASSTVRPSGTSPPLIHLPAAAPPLRPPMRTSSVGVLRRARRGDGSPAAFVTSGSSPALSTTTRAMTVQRARTMKWDLREDEAGFVRASYADAALMRSASPDLSSQPESSAIAPQHRPRLKRTRNTPRWRPPTTQKAPATGPTNALP